MAHPRVPDLTQRRPAGGRQRQYDDELERQMIVEAADAELRRHGTALTVHGVLEAAGVSTRSFYRHFESKDALLCALYRRDAEYAAARLRDRVEAAASPLVAVDAWIDEIYLFRRSRRRAERVAVMRSVAARQADGAQLEAEHGLRQLVWSLHASIAAGIESGLFAPGNAMVIADLVAAAVVRAVGLSETASRPSAPQDEVVAFVHRALGVVER